MTSTGKLTGKSTADDVVEGVDLAGRRIVVTGANTGIGFDTARALAAAGATVVLACRDEAKATATAARIRAMHPAADLVCAALDLASFASIRAFAEQLGDAPLDVLVCNAGLTTLEWATTTEGVELTVGVCHFGHFLLTRLLAERLLAAPAPRVVMVSSESHRSPPELDFDRFPMREDNFRGLVAYGQAKLCNLLFARSLQARYGERGLMACALHPGTLVTTDIGRDNAMIRLLMRLVSPFTKSSNQGAATTVWAAVHEPAGELGGEYLRDCAVASSTEQSQDPATAERLWTISEAFVDATLGEEGGAPAWP